MLICSITAGVVVAVGLLVSGFIAFIITEMVNAPTIDDSDNHLGGFGEISTNDEISDRINEMEGEYK